MKALLNDLFQHKRLSSLEAKNILLEISTSRFNEAHLASFMTVFMMRPISVDELSGFRDALIELAIPLILLGLVGIQKTPSIYLP
jgi:anthranilate phosphoribosyltransferase